MTLVQTELKKIYLWPNVIDMQWPAPTWYHVPSKDENVALVAAMTALWMDTSNWNCMKTYLKMPFAGCRRSSSSIYNQGETGFYWSATAAGAHAARVMLFYSEDLYPQLGDCRSFGYSIRCFKNTPAIPDNNWTTLFDWSSIATWAWIFHNTTAWLISISSDWQNRITIQDKNLWASTVYNDWDTLSEANCWKYFQWWNNYGFAWTWSVTTSSTKVDASNYWPWNYYSSSTFITTNITDWSSVQNDNLWWWQYTPIKRVTIRPNGQEKQIRPVWRLPAEYQEVEYIQSSWTQYFNVWTTFNTNYKVVADLQMLNSTSDQVPFGVKQASGWYTYKYWINVDNNLFYISAWSADWKTFSANTNRHTITINKTSVTIDSTSGTINHQSFTYSLGLWVFRYNWYDPIYSSNKLYKLEIYNENWDKICDLVPWYRKSDSVIGMYDLVNGVFYTNQGTWTFTKWNDVNWIQTLNNSLNNSLSNTFTPTITPDIPDTPWSWTWDILTI